MRGGERKVWRKRMRKETMWDRKHGGWGRGEEEGARTEKRERKMVMEKVIYEGEEERRKG